ncbi:hypothetical protein AAVH_30141, partial [Aphelenchoides avenae]
MSLSSYPKSPSYVTLRLVNFGIIPAPVFDRTWATSVLFFLNTFCITSQECYHVAIAFNRYTAFRDPLAYNEKWARYYLKRAIYVATAASLACSVSRLFTDAAVVQNTTGIIVVHLDRLAFEVSMYTALAMISVCTLASFILNLASFRAYLRWSVSMKRSLNEEYRFLVFAVLQLIIQAFLLLIFVLVLYAGGAESPVATVVMVLYPYASVLFSL